MTAILEVKKTLDPLSRSWGWSVRHPATGDGSWGFSESDAVHALMKRLYPLGYDCFFAINH